MAATWDVFISYARADQHWVRTLATNLHNLGLDICFDDWEIGPGDVLVHSLDEGLLRSRTGVLVVSPAALTRPWVQKEYAAMLTRAVEGQQRLIPVLLADAEMPPLLASCVWIDFRHTDEHGDRLPLPAMGCRSRISGTPEGVAALYARRTRGERSHVISTALV